MAEAVEAALKEAERVAKKQKTCTAATSDALRQLTESLERARAGLDGASTAEASQQVLEELVKELKGLDAAGTLAAQTRELHGAVSKLSKVVEKGFSTDICKAAWKQELDAAALRQAVAEHLFHEGRFDVGELFVREASVSGGDALKQPYVAMHSVLQEIQKHNLQPVLDWVREHDTQLRGPSGNPSDFEFSIHRLAFLHALRHQGQPAALQYAREHLSRFHATHMQQMQRLMGAMCFAKRDSAGAASPYADLFSMDLWNELGREFVRQSCALLGQGQDSPLLVALAAGSAALPTLLKLASVVAVQPAAELAGQANQLPVEIPLGKEFVFRSVFACPVSREQSTPENPPMMLPCGHCMCKQSILKIAKATNRAFKCPYCPQEATVVQCRQLVL